MILINFASLQVSAQRSNTPASGSERRTENRSRGAVRSNPVQIERIAYFTEKIGLTSAEAQLFWPVYNEMDNKRNELFEERAAIVQEFVNNAGSLNDRQIDEQLKRLVAIQQQEAALPAEYDAQFRKILPTHKVMNLYVAEMGFRNYLLQRIQNRPQ